MPSFSSPTGIRRSGSLRDRGVRRILSPVSDRQLHAVLDAWRLEPVGDITATALGTMNETFVVTTPVRRLVLRRHRRTDRSVVEREHDVIGRARDHGIPAPAAIPTPAGDRVVDHAGRLYSLFSYAPGRQVARDDLTPQHARSMGEMLARVHLALEDSAFAPSPVPDRPSREDTLRRLADIVEVIERHPDPGPQEQWALQRLRSRERWLRSGADPVPPAPDPEPLELIHGDYQESNLFFTGSAVAAVIDWDKAEPAHPADEIVRATYLSLHLAESRCAAFLAGYRAIRAVGADLLDRAAARYAFGQAHGLWLYETIYLRGDDRPRQFLQPGTFVPFADRWRAARTGFG
jgi:Ser/Thr protein kinase RdoA (MazF antagonist)